jgi:hypothetical protein
MKTKGLKNDFGGYPTMSMIMKGLLIISDYVVDKYGAYPDVVMCDSAEFKMLFAGSACATKSQSEAGLGNERTH